MHLFYKPGLNDSVSQFTMSAEESKHILKVLRKKKDDTLHVTNGKGDLFKVVILSADPKGCTVGTTGVHRRPPKMYSLHMGVAPTKMMDRYEWFLEKVTEIGVQEVTPVICERSERKIIKPERLEKVMQAAMKQSLRSYLPKLHPVTTYARFIAGNHQGLRFIAHCEDGEKSELIRSVVPDKDITLLIGPEGDFTNSEIQRACEAGFSSVSLGEARLRTETAAIVACTMINMINGG